MADDGVTPSDEDELFETRLDVHDRKQFELKLEYQPSGTDPQSEYLVEALLFIPRSLNIGPDTWTRESFYADLHNYVRLSTPELTFDELLTGGHSPLVQLEERLQLGLAGPEREVVYDAKMLACVFRGALRGFARQTERSCVGFKSVSAVTGEPIDGLLSRAHESIAATQQVLKRYRTLLEQLPRRFALEDKSRAALRLVDEYMSLLVEQYFRRVVVDMDALPRTPEYLELRRELMEVVISDESYRRELKLPSVLAVGGNNEEYAHRVSFLKKFCQNILFLEVERSSTRKAWEEVLFALAAGSAMAFALGVGLFAQSRYPQASFNFFLIAVVGYMVKDRIKEGLRRLLSSYLGRVMYERTTRIVDPVTQDDMGECREKVDYGAIVEVPPEVDALRRGDDLITAAQGELAETVMRYRKKIILNSEMLPRIADGIVTGVTDIIRLNVGRLLHDMDDPEYALDYVDLEDFSVGKVTLSKSYHLDLAFRFSVDDGTHRRTSVRCVRLVLDRNGIKRMTELGGPSQPPAPRPSGP